MAKPLGYRSTALDALRGADLTGKVAVVTGEMRSSGARGWCGGPAEPPPANWRQCVQAGQRGWPLALVVLAAPCGCLIHLPESATDLCCCMSWPPCTHPPIPSKPPLQTGGNSGIGVETVRALAHAGADVVLCSRSVEAGQKVAEQLAAGDMPLKVRHALRDGGCGASVVEGCAGWEQGGAGWLLHAPHHTPHAHSTHAHARITGSNQCEAWHDLADPTCSCRRPPPASILTLLHTHIHSI